MCSRTFDTYWVWLGLLVGVLPVVNLAHLPDVGLDVLSIFFGGLLAIASILPNIQNFKAIQRIRESGHIRDLIAYIHVPLWTSFVLIVAEFGRRTITLPSTTPDHVGMIFSVIVLALWGLFICSLLRLLLLLPQLLDDS